MQQMKLLDIDYGMDCNDRNRLVGEAVRKLQEQIGLQDTEEFNGLWKEHGFPYLGMARL